MEARPVSQHFKQNYVITQQLTQVIDHAVNLAVEGSELSVHAQSTGRIVCPACSGTPFSLAMGDINQDGNEDIVIGLPNAISDGPTSKDEQGIVYVVWGGGPGEYCYIALL